MHKQIQLYNFCLVITIIFFYTKISAPPLCTIASDKQILMVHKNLLESCSNPAMEATIFKYLFANDPIYAENFADRLNATVEIFYDLIQDDLLKRTQACLMFPQLTIEEPYNHTLEKVIAELIPLYFDPKGTLLTTIPSDTTTRNFIIAQFLKNGLDQNHYKNLLRIFNFQGVLDHEEETFSYLLNNLYYIATGGWLPSRTQYPKNIKTLIKDNPTNKVTHMILAYSKDHLFAKAYTLLSTYPTMICLELYMESYTAYKKQYCCEHGILKQHAHDPLCAQKSTEDKQQLAQDIHALTSFNNQLIARAQLKNKLHDEWAIPTTAPECVHEMLYDLIENTQTGTAFITQISQLIAQFEDDDRKPLQQAVYLPGGILKQFGPLPGAHQYQFPQQLLDDQELLNEINQLFYTQHICAGMQEGVIARLQLDQLHASFDPSLQIEQEPIDYDPEATHPHSFYQHICSRASALGSQVTHYTKVTLISIKKAITCVAQIVSCTISA